MADDKPYTIHSPTKITLGPVAKEMARMHGMSLEEMGRHLLAQEKLRADGLTQKQGEN